MALFRRSRTPASPARPAPTPELEALVERLARPAVFLAPRDGPPPGPGQCQVGGHPSWPPEAAPWPTWHGQPMAFLLQLDLTQVTVATERSGHAIPGLPGRGLLQWFVGADVMHGLDGPGGAAGIELRWLPDPDVGSLHNPTDPTPWHRAQEEGHDVRFPLYDESVRHVGLTGGRTLPWGDDLSEADGDVVRAWWGRADPEIEDVWAEEVLAADGPWGDLEPGSTLGGHARFLQEDPRGEEGYPDAEDPDGALLVQLTETFEGWGDLGSAHLFGDWAAVGRGELDAVTYSWET